MSELPTPLVAIWTGFPKAMNCLWRPRHHQTRHRRLVNLVLIEFNFNFCSDFAAPKLGVRSPGVLGFWVALPAALLGLTAALRGGYYRYLGFMDNGNLTRYPGYVEDNTPWFVKHSVSDRHFKVSPNFHLDTRLKQQNEDSSRLQ